MKRVFWGCRQAVVNHGWGDATLTASRSLLTRLHRPPISVAASVRWQNTAQHSFDAEHGVDTSGLIWGADLSTNSSNAAWTTAYYGVAPSIFHSVVGHLPASLRGATFIDMGSGKGRAVMLATLYPFGKVVGVELSPELHAIASTNLAAYTHHSPQHAPVELVQGDAAAYAFPDGPLVVYLYHPFCRPVLRQVLANLRVSLEAQPRPAAVIYINAELREMLDRAPFLKCRWSETLEMDAPDLLADRIGSSQEECALYCTPLA